MTASVRSYAVIIALLAAFAGCKGKRDEGRQTRAAEAEAEGAAGVAAAQAGSEVAVALQLNWVPEPEFGGFYAAVHKGMYEQHGMKVDIVAGSAGVQTWKMVATGKVPFAIATAGEVLRARLKDANVVGLFAVYQKSPRAIMVHASSGVTSLGEVFSAGKIDKVAMEAGLPFVRFLQKTYPFDRTQIIQYGGNLSLFLQDPRMAQQCFVFSEPVSAKQQGVDVTAFSVAESGFNPYLAVVITSDEYLQKNRDVVDRFVRATRQGWQAYLDDPGPTNQHMRTQGATMELEAMNLAAELQASYVVSDETRARYLGYMSEERWRTLGEQLRELGELDAVPDVTRAFVNIAP